MSYSENPPEMERLLRKYGGGNIPPLIANPGEETDGLFSAENEEMLKALVNGFSSIYGIPLRIHIASGNYQRRTAWTNLRSGDSLAACNKLGSCRNWGTKVDPIDEIYSHCKLCIEEYILTLHGRKPVAYMCCVGMVGFAVPVYVSDKVVALLLTECRKPKEGAIWPVEIVQVANCAEPFSIISFRDPTKSSPSRMDIWQESKRRIQECEKALSLEPNSLLKRITDDVETGSLKEISPEDFSAVMNGQLEKIGKHLSDLASNTYRLEKESLIGWIRAEMASALSTIDTFWDKIRWCLGNLVRLVGMDYVVLISYDRSNTNPTELLCQYGLPEELFPALQYNDPNLAGQVNEFIRKMNGENIQEIDLRQYRDVPILNILYSAYGKGTNYPVLVAPAPTLGRGLSCMVLGKRNPVMRRSKNERSTERLCSYGDLAGISEETLYIPATEWLSPDDYQYVATIARELSIIVRVLVSMKKMQEAKEEQTNLLESVAHDLKTPISNIMVAADNLRNARTSPERASRTIAGIVTQLERLSLLAEKAWMLEQIRMDSLVYNDEQTDIYTILTECRDIMADLAESKSIEIHIDPEIKNWRSVYLDPEKFRLVVMNLIHNGIKYSFPNTHIRIGGSKDVMGIGVALTFTNEGIPIHDEEKDRIFDRYFRSKDAIKMDPSGSGIGLVLVKEFVDHYKGRIDIKSTEVSFGVYLNVFSIYLPGR